MPLVLIAWNISYHSLLALSVSIEKSAASLIRAPLYVTSCFSLGAFKILSLSCTIAVLIMVCLEVGLFGLLLIRTLCFLDLYDFFSHQIREVFHYYFFKHGLDPLLFFFSFWYPYYTDIIMFNVVIQLTYHLFILSKSVFPFLLFLGVFSTLSSSSLI